MSILFDAHCHAARKVSTLLPPSSGGGMRARLVCGVAPADWEVVADWAGKWAGTVPAFGIHPWEAGISESGWEEELEAFLLRIPAAWVGEIGLDAAKVSRVPMERQEEVFRRQLRRAARLGRGVNVHCVRADDELLRALDEEYFSAGAGCAIKCIVHSFAGAHPMIDRLAARGAYFTVGPLAARRDTPKIRDRAALLPVERILLESDAFLAPGVDAAEDLLFALRWLAGVRGMTPDALMDRITENSERILHGRD